jgi:hypothetical protein
MQFARVGFWTSSAENGLLLLAARVLDFVVRDGYIGGSERIHHRRFLQWQ